MTAVQRVASHHDASTLLAGFNESPKPVSSSRSTSFTLGSTVMATHSINTPRISCLLSSSPSHLAYSIGTTYSFRLRRLLLT